MFYFSVHKKRSNNIAILKKSSIFASTSAEKRINYTQIGSY